MITQKQITLPAFSRRFHLITELIMSELGELLKAGKQFRIDAHPTCISVPNRLYLYQLKIKKMLGVPKATHRRYEVIMDILSFKSLHEKWDGFDALPVEVKSATNAIKLMDYIGEDVFCEVSNYFPNPNGTITFEWENDENEIVSVEVGNDSFTYFVDAAATQTKFYNNLPLDVEHTQMLSTYIQKI